jgi:hypothetical protein
MRTLRCPAPKMKMGTIAIGSLIQRKHREILNHKWNYKDHTVVWNPLDHPPS